MLGLAALIALCASGCGSSGPTHEIQVNVEVDGSCVTKLGRGTLTTVDVYVFRGSDDDLCLVSGPQTVPPEGVASVDDLDLVEKGNVRVVLLGFNEEKVCECTADETFAVRDGLEQTLTLEWGCDRPPTTAGCP